MPEHDEEVGQERGKMGRPHKASHERKSYNVQFRVKRDMREWLLSEGAKTGRNMSEQVSYVLERARTTQDVLGELRPLLSEWATEIHVDEIVGSLKEDGHKKQPDPDDENYGQNNFLNSHSLP